MSAASSHGSASSRARAGRRGVLGLLAIGAIAVALTIGAAIVGSWVVGPPDGPLVVRQPYLARVTATSVLVGWKTSVPTEGSVSFGPTAPATTLESAAATHHLVALSGLEPDTRYRVQVRVEPPADAEPSARADGSGTLFSLAVTTLPDSPSSSVRLAVVGDFGDGADAQVAVAERIQELRPDLLLTTGDNAYESGSEADLDLRLFPQYADLLTEVPIAAALGNHDVRTDDGAPGRRAFGVPDTGYYAFDAGPARVVILDSNDRCLEAGCPQVDWLAADLTGSTRPFTFVVLHHTMSSCGPHGTDRELREAWHPLFAAAGVDLVLMGHDHGYQRSQPIDGVTYVTTGGGGGEPYRWSEPCPEAAVVVDADSPGGAAHAVVVDVGADRALVRAVRGSDGAILDEVELTP